MFKSVFAEGDEWKQKRVDESLAYLRRQEVIKQQKKVQECVEAFMNNQEKQCHQDQQ